MSRRMQKINFRPAFVWPLVCLVLGLIAFVNAPDHAAAFASGVAHRHAAADGHATPQPASSDHAGDCHTGEVGHCNSSSCTSGYAGIMTVALPIPSLQTMRLAFFHASERFGTVVDRDPPVPRPEIS